MSIEPIIVDVGDQWDLGSEVEDYLYEKITDLLFPLVSEQIIKAINGSLSDLKLELWDDEDSDAISFLLRGDGLLGDGSVEFSVEHVIANSYLAPTEAAKFVAGLRRMADLIEKAVQ